MSDFEECTEAADWCVKQTKLEQDTGQCFLCLQEVIFNSEIISGNDKRWIRDIFEYLDTSPNGLKILETDEYYPRVTNDSSIHLCTSCSAITKKLSSLFSEMKVTRMWIEYQIKEVHKTLQASEHEENSNYDVHHLRRKLKSKCNSEANRIFGPRVHLKRTEVEPEKVVKHEPLEDWNTEETIWSNPEVDVKQAQTLEEIGISFTTAFAKLRTMPPESAATFTKEISLPPATKLEKKPTQNIHQSDSKKKRKIPPKNMPGSNFTRRLPKQAYIYLTKQVNSNGQRQCSLCNESLQPFGKTQYYYVAVHVAKEHLEQYFLHLKHTTLDITQFSKCCRHVLNIELYKARPLTAEKIFKCQHCEFSSFKRTYRLFVPYLISSHYNNLSRGISKLQKLVMEENLEDLDTYLNDKLPVRVSVKAFVQTEYWLSFCKAANQLYKQSQCTLCERDVEEKSFKMHLIPAHPETLFEAAGYQKAVTKQRFHKLCMYLMNWEANLARKDKRKNGGSVRMVYECHLCKVVTQRYQDRLYHLAFKHFHVLKEKLGVLEKDTGLCIPKLQVTSEPKKWYKIGDNADQVVSELCNQFCEKLEDWRWKNCKLCGGIMSSQNQKYLFVRKHMDRVFEKAKLENVYNSEFELCCNELVNREFRQAKLSGGIYFQCKYCDRNFSRCRVETVKDHLVMHHFELVNEQLVRFQRERVWERDGDSDEKEIEREKCEEDEHVAENVKRNKVEDFFDESEEICQVDSVVTGESDKEIETEGVTENFSDSASQSDDFIRLEIPDW